MQARKQSRNNATNHRIIKAMLCMHAFGCYNLCDVAMLLTLCVLCAAIAILCLYRAIQLCTLKRGKKRVFFFFFIKRGIKSANCIPIIRRFNLEVPKIVDLIKYCSTNHHYIEWYNSKQVGEHIY